jgi:GNAT superfamily N-acetyltransferase
VIAAPVLLTASHEVEGFDSGNPALDTWLRRRALVNQENGASRTYVLTEAKRVIGYYALASGSVAAAEAPGKIKRNMPDPVPVMILGRLAIDRRCQGKGLGTDLLRDAVLRTMQAAEIGGIRALLVHAVDERGAAFYLRAGFIASPVRPLTLLLLLPRLSADQPIGGAPGRPGS